jgi:hypothetical protein
MVSEDSLHRVAPLTATIHSFSESKNRAVIRVRQVPPLEHRDSVAKPCEVLSLLTDQRKPLEERDDPPADVREVDLPPSTSRHFPLCAWFRSRASRGSDREVPDRAARR